MKKLLPLALFVFLLGACAPKPAETPGLANPASIYCEKQGGRLEIRSEAGGETGYCLFDDGSECEEWAYFHHRCAPGSSLAESSPAAAATATASPAGLANPAAVYCEAQGGRSVVVKTDAGETGYCLFRDSSQCDEWAYYRGECAPGRETTLSFAPGTTHLFTEGILMVETP